MIRFRIQELMAEKQFKEGRRITLLELAEATGISRVTLSKMVNQRGYGTLTDHLDRLCSYFECPIEQLAQHIPDVDVASQQVE
jgi:putative transcriptional regulator